MKIFVGVPPVEATGFEAEAGAQITINGTHATEARLTIKAPVNATALREFDRIFLFEAVDGYSYPVTQQDFDSVTGLFSWGSAISRMRADTGETEPQAFTQAFNGYPDDASVRAPVMGAVLYYPHMLFSGEIKEIKQVEENANIALEYREFELTLSGKAQTLYRVYCDMGFPAGASVAQILAGNHSGEGGGGMALPNWYIPAWYNPAMQEFAGLLEYRIVPEGIRVGNLDDFSLETIPEMALLWGLSIGEALDTLAQNCGAYWEITANDVLNFRYTHAEKAAPQQLLPGTPNIWDLQTTRDSFTTYSAVRVIGGKGPAAPSTAVTRVSHDPDFVYGDVSITDSTHAKLRFPLLKYNGFIAGEPHSSAIIRATNGGVAYRYGMYYDGIETPPANTPAILCTSGSDELTAVGGLTFPTGFPAKPPLSSTFGTAAYLEIGYVPEDVPIVVRLSNQQLKSEIAKQAGGSGLSEYVLNDSNIKTFNDAVQTATSLLDGISHRTIVIQFNTKQGGYKVGQLIYGSIPYYGIDDDYLITQVSATVADIGTGVAADPNKAIWEYRIEASSAAYRDSLKGLFYTKKMVSFKFGSDFPASDGAMLTTKVGLLGEVNIFRAKAWEDFNPESSPVFSSTDLETLAGVRHFDAPTSGDCWRNAFTDTWEPWKTLTKAKVIASYTVPLVDSSCAKDYSGNYYKIVPMDIVDLKVTLYDNGQSGTLDNLTRVSGVYPRADDSVMAAGSKIIEIAGINSDGRECLLYLNNMDKATAPGYLVYPVSTIVFPGTDKKVFDPTAEPLTWAQIDEQNKTWDELCSADGINYGTPGYSAVTTDMGAAILAQAYAGGTPVYGSLDGGHKIRLVDEEAQINVVLDATEEPIYHSTSLTDSFREYYAYMDYLLPVGVSQHFTRLDWINKTGVVIASQPVDIDTRSGVLHGGNGLRISTLLGPRGTEEESIQQHGDEYSYFTAAMAAFLSYQLCCRKDAEQPGGNEYVLGITQNIALYDASAGSYTIGRIKPSAGPTINGRNIDTTYYITPASFGDFTKIATYQYLVDGDGVPYLQNDLPFHFNKVVTNLYGQYAIVLIKRDRVI